MDADTSTRRPLRSPAAFAGPPAGRSPRQASLREASSDRARSVADGHGRVEVRSPEATAWPAESLGAGRPGWARASRLRRERRSRGGVGVGEPVGITGPPRERAVAARSPASTRARRGIEDGLHGRRDGPSREDAGRARGAGAAGRRDPVTSPRRRSSRPTLAAATRSHTGHPEKSIELLPRPL